MLTANDLALYYEFATLEGNYPVPRYHLIERLPVNTRHYLLEPFAQPDQTRGVTELIMKFEEKGWKMLEILLRNALLYGSLVLCQGLVDLLKQRRTEQEFKAWEAWTFQYFCKSYDGPDFLSKLELVVRTHILNGWPVTWPDNWLGYNQFDPMTIYQRPTVLRGILSAGLPVTTDVWYSCAGYSLTAFETLPLLLRLQPSLASGVTADKTLARSRFI